MEGARYVGMCSVCDLCFFFFKQKTAYEMRISDWSSDVCSSDLALVRGPGLVQPGTARPDHRDHEIADRSPAAGFEGHAPDAGSRPCRHAGLRRDRKSVA